MLQLADDNKILQGLEDEILRLLSESSGNVLDDEVLISARLCCWEGWEGGPYKNFVRF